MFKFVFLACLILPVSASAADYIGTLPHHHRYSRDCHHEQWGNKYCVVVPPVEKLITDCDPGVDCHHMQSGQHYSVQRPTIIVE
jgi:hypothetical protein